MAQRKRGFLVMMLAAALVIASGCTSVSGSDNEEPTPTPIPPPEIAEQPTYTVERGEVVDRITFNGRVSPTIEEELFFRVNGRVKTVLVKRNDLVDEGQILAELENSDLLRQLAQAQIELSTAESNLASAQGSRETDQADAEAKLQVQRLQLQKLRGGLAILDLDVQLARAKLDAAQAGPSPEELAISQANLERAKNSLWSAQISRDAACGSGGTQCDLAQANVQRAEEEVRIQELNMQIAQAGPSSADLLALRTMYEKALQARRNADVDIAILVQQMESAEQALVRLAAHVDPQAQAAVERATLSVERLEAQIADTQIVSPLSGRLTTSSVTEGSDATAFRTVIVVSDEGELEITADPTTVQLDKMSEGMTADLVLARYPGQLLTGTIYQLPYPYGGGGGADLETTDRKTRISFDTADLDLSPGDLVRVDVTVAQQSDALWLPPAAIRTFSGRSFVVVEEEGSQRRVDVRLGIQGVDRVEILDGLEEGQIVIGQ